MCAEGEHPMSKRVEILFKSGATFEFVAATFNTKTPIAGVAGFEWTDDDRQVHTCEYLNAENIDAIGVFHIEDIDDEYEDD